VNAAGFAVLRADRKGNVWLAGVGEEIGMARVMVLCSWGFGWLLVRLS
jgi:hypothetical protein